MPSTSRSRSAGPSRVGRPGGISPVVGTPSAGSPSSVAATIDSATTASATGLPGKQALAEHEQQDRDDADGEHQIVDLAELAGQQHGPLEEIVPAAGHAEQARQLGHGDGQPGAGLEADQDAVADQLHERAQPQQPGDQASAATVKAARLAIFT